MSGMGLVGTCDIKSLEVTPDKLKLFTTEENKLLENGELCEICYGNCKNIRHKCDECSNNICIKCVSECSEVDVDNNKYTRKCPYCRTDKTYDFDKLTTSEMIAFYKVLNDEKNKYKKPASFDNLDYQYYYKSTQLSIDFLRNFQEVANSNTKKGYMEQEKLLRYTIDELTYIRERREAVIERRENAFYRKAIDELAKLNAYKELYLSSQRYNTFLKHTLDNQKNQLKLLEDIKNQNIELLNDNRKLYDKMTDIENTLNDTTLSRKPQQKIKLITDKIIRTEPMRYINLTFELHK